MEGSFYEGEHWTYGGPYYTSFDQNYRMGDGPVFTSVVVPEGNLPPVAPIPEPSIYVAMVVGLVFVAWRKHNA